MYDRMWECIQMGIQKVLRDVNDTDVTTTVAYNVIYIFGLWSMFVWMDENLLPYGDK